MNGYFCIVSTHIFDEYTRGLQSSVLFVTIGDLQREILAENQTQVESMEKVKKHENKGRRLDFAEHETKKGKRDTDTC